MALEQLSQRWSFAAEPGPAAKDGHRLSGAINSKRFQVQLFYLEQNSLLESILYLVSVFDNICLNIDNLQ